jgi:hypothetical protein
MDTDLGTEVVAVNKGRLYLHRAYGSMGETTNRY